MAEKINRDKRESAFSLLTFGFDMMAPSAFSDVCLKENMTLADRLCNLQLIQEFCKENLSSCCHFSLEDMLYASSTIKVLGETIKSNASLNNACSMAQVQN